MATCAAFSGVLCASADPDFPSPIRGAKTASSPNTDAGNGGAREANRVIARDLRDLITLGEHLDRPIIGRSGITLRHFAARMLLRIRDKRGALVRLRANAAQRLFEARHRRKSIVLKARQMGISTWIAARFFLSTITRPGTVTVQVAHDQRAAEQIFRIVHRFWANLPRRLRVGALRLGRANVRQITFPLLDSEYRVETAADPDAGRGTTIRNLHASEVARWPGDAESTLATLTAAVPPDGEIVLESTPSGASGTFYDAWQRARSTGTVRHFFPWWLEAAYRAPAKRLRLTAEERELQRRHSLTPEQIAFRRTLRANFRKLAAQEFAEDAESCFLTSGDCVFELPLIAAQLAACGEPIAVRGGVSVFAPPLADRQYVMGVDVAGGGSEGDYACAQVIDRQSAMQCAELHGHLSPEELAAAVLRLAREYNDAQVAVERNNHGHAVLAHLGRVHHYHNLYEHRGVLGWPTNVVTRPQMVAALSAMLTAAPEAFCSAALLREMRSFVRLKDGRQAAQAGAYDDRLMAMAIALKVREEV